MEPPADRSAAGSPATSPAAARTSGTGSSGARTARNPDPRIAEILRALDPPKGYRLWHGGATTLGALRGVDAETASWKPAPDRHSIWELALHIAYWKYAVRRLLTGEPRGGFPRSPANWPEVAAPFPDPHSREEWAADRTLLRDEHARLVRAIRDLDPRALDEPVPPEESGGGRDWIVVELLFGIVSHDLYHTGQIQLMKRLHRSLGGTREASG